MRAPIDVLAVMNFASEGLEECRLIARSADLDEARDAVAELIEAIGPALCELRDRSDAKKDLIAALARVKGTP